MEFVKLNGYIGKDSSFISIEIKGGNNKDSIGDQVWINKEGTIMEVLDYADEDVLNDAADLFSGNHKSAFKGALRRMGVNF